eukprot:9305535-Ditylum_brightwellii.AAC.1
MAGPDVVFLKTCQKCAVGVHYRGLKLWCNEVEMGKRVCWVWCRRRARPIDFRRRLERHCARQ